ncbi:MAG TPA: hypothetical protein VGB67_16345 [Fibrella sp.]
MARAYQPWDRDPDYETMGNPTENHRKAVRIKLDKIHSEMKFIGWQLFIIMGMLGFLIGGSLIR